MFRTPVDDFFFPTFRGSEHGSSYRGQNYIENDLRGNENRFELARVKLQGMYDGNPGQIDFGSS